MTTLIWTLVLALLGLLAGWLGPMAVKSRRPYGMAGDLVAAILVTVGLGLLYQLWFMDLFDFPDWLDLAATLGDPLGAALIVLWLMRKLSPEQPEAA